jgi:hypothetical protein
MSKYNDILRKYNIMNSIFLTSLFVGLVSGLVYYIYISIKYGALTEKTISTLFISIGISIVIPLITMAIMRIKYGKVLKLVNFKKDTVEKTIDYLLNGDSYNSALKKLNDHLDKFKNEEIDKEKILHTILESHNYDNRNMLLNHAGVLKIEKIIKSL